MPEIYCSACAKLDRGKLCTRHSTTSLLKFACETVAQRLEDEAGDDPANRTAPKEFVPEALKRYAKVLREAVAIHDGKNIADAISDLEMACLHLR